MDANYEASYLLGEEDVRHDLLQLYLGHLVSVSRLHELSQEIFTFVHVEGNEYYSLSGLRGVLNGQVFTHIIVRLLSYVRWLRR